MTDELSGSGTLRTIQFTLRFLDDLTGSDFTTAERRRILRALVLLDSNERHPSLRVHELQGSLKGTWSASASDQLRIHFERIEGGRKRLLRCIRHYQR